MPNKNIDDKIDALGLSIGRGFEEVHRKFDDVRNDLNEVRGDVRAAITRLDRIEVHTGGLAGRVEMLEDTIRVIKTKLEIR